MTNIVTNQSNTPPTGYPQQVQPPPLTPGNPTATIPNAIQMRDHYYQPNLLKTPQALTEELRKLRTDVDIINQKLGHLETTMSVMEVGKPHQPVPYDVKAGYDPPKATEIRDNWSTPFGAQVMPQALTPAEVQTELAALQSDLAKLNLKMETLITRVDPVTAATSNHPVSHVVKAGDYLEKIAREQLGNASRWPEIYELNRDVIGENPDLLKPGQKLRLPRPAPTQTPPTPTTFMGTPDIPPPLGSNRSLSDQDALRLAKDFGLLPRNGELTPDLKANVIRFLDEMDAYQTTERGKVFGPGIEDITSNPQEKQQIRASVQMIQQGLDLLIKAGKLRVTDTQGRALQGLSASGSFFKLDAQGREQKDASDNPILDEEFIQAVVRFKKEHGIHQNYKMPDGTWAVNEYVGPATIEALKKALLDIQRNP